MSLSKNFLYNMLYQIIVILLPFITIPYVSRVLGSSSIGIFSFTDSVVQYFVFLAVLGTTMYGNRTIAYSNDNIERRSVNFWSIFIIKVITTSVAFVLFYFTIFRNSKEYKFIYLLQLVNLLSAGVDISWLFTGLEDFKRILSRNLVIRLLAILALFVFVKNPDDLWKYTIINTGSNFLGQLIMWLYVPKYIKKVKITFKDMSKHLVPIIRLFILQIAIQIYSYLDKTMLGIMAVKSEVGLYEMSQKLIRIILALITSMGTVMVPRISNLYANNNINAIKDYISKMFKFTLYISIALVLGLCGIINEFVPWFFGHDFLKVIKLTYVIAPVILIIPLGNIIGVQLMIPMGKELQVSLCPISGAIINVILNIFLIPRFYSIGASFASVMAELVGTLLTIFMMRDFLPFKTMFNEVWKYIISGIIMFIVVRAIGIFMGARIVTTLVQVTIGGLIYFSCLLFLKSETNKMVIDKTVKSLYLKIKK